MHRTVASRRLLQGFTRTNRVVGRVSRHRYAQHVPKCLQLQPGPVSVGCVIRHRYELYVPKCLQLQQGPVSMGRVIRYRYELDV